MKSDTSGDMPTFYMSDESEKREHSHRFTSSDVDCFKIQEKKKKKVLRKRRHKIKAVNSSLETVKEKTIKAKLSPTVCRKDVESRLNTVKSDTCKEIDVSLTVILIGSSKTEKNAESVPLNLTTETKKEIDTSACSTSQAYSDMPTYSQVQTQDCQSE